MPHPLSMTPVGTFDDAHPVPEDMTDALRWMATATAGGVAKPLRRRRASVVVAGLALKE